MDELLETPASMRPDQDAPAPLGYVWLDPMVAKRLAARLAELIGALEPNWREDAQSNAAAFAKEIDQVIAEVWPGEAQGAATSEPTRRTPAPFLSLDPGYDSIAHAFGFEPVEVPIVDHLTLPLTASELRRLSTTVETQSMTTIFYSVETPQGLVRDLQSRLKAHVTLVPLDAFGSSAARGPRTYAELLRYNLGQLRKALPDAATANSGS
jgi:ABC-type Zn uptake system ZnuABC Zn-binding protein ZnuA